MITGTIYVYADWDGLDGPNLMGALNVAHARGKEIFSFEYAHSWLQAGMVQYLDPDLQFFSGPQYIKPDKPNFGLFMDSSPDRWGRLLIKRREAILARRENRNPESLYEADFLLGVFDESRMGALRFKTDPNGVFLSYEKDLATPPYSSLRSLEHASLQLERETGDTETIKWLNMLLAPGSSLGGARPKANVRDADKTMWIAKFPKGNDTHNVGGWEIIALEIAARAGIRVPAVRAQRFSGDHHTFLTKRFDRTQADRRIHFASAMTLLGKNDGDGFQEDVSYLNLAEFIVRYGSRPQEDLRELWKRIVLNICISNTDDHLRNHGFLLEDTGWRLSPAYDLNPEPYGHGLSLNISQHENIMNTDLALSVAEHFRITDQEGKDIITEIKAAAAHWQQLAQKYQIPRQEQEMMAPAFRH